ncbi:TIGR00266 family protein (plasmid) [Deinococcus sp. KNUC1210]|uniref:TIGR00266 family protein n=1 Tax=Deinococcus sp. KNUC1210 TaxID=2917691 RepID=UPI001EF0FCB0|nr:TIGR00266 family protein [Deinococcus sp. KNUC1210]ULH17097.1 TIGR00266 family protein [Deinococcus sp. KNUC1210]
MIPELPNPAEVNGTARSGMTYRIFGTVQPTLIVDVDSRHNMISDAGGMSWMSASVEMTTGAPGGLLAGLARMVSGGTLFMITFNTRTEGQIAFAADFPGKIVPMELDAGESIIMHKHAFLASEASVQLAVTFTRRFGAGLVGGDGFVLQKVTGPGMAFAELDGDAIEYNLQVGETLLVEPGHLAMFDPSVNFDIQMMKGIRNLIFSGEALFFARLQGPGRVWLNSMTASKVAHRIGEYLPSSGS